MSLSASNSICDIRRQSEVPSPQELKDFIQGGELRPSLLNKQRDSSHHQSWRWGYKNLFGISVSFMVLYGVFLGVIGLQSSLNDAEGLGLASLSALNAVYIISGLFSSSVTRLFGTKYTLIICYIVMTVYTISNYYPHWYTLIPGSVFVGIIYAPLWAALYVHVTTIAIQYATAVEENQSYLVALFTGIFTMFYKIAYIPVNIVSSVILLNGREGNTSIIDTSLGDVCNNTEAANLDQLYLYILLSVYVLFDIVAIVLLISFVDNLGTDTRFLSPTRMFVKKPFVATLKMMLNWKLILVIPMITLDGFIVSFSLGHFAKVYVSDCIGVHWIGVALAIYGLGSGLTALTAGRAVKYIPQYFIVYTFLCINVGIVIFMLLWEREPSYISSFLILFGLGICEGVWISTPSGLVGIFFPQKQEEAYSVLYIGIGVGYLIGFLSAIFFDTEIHLWFTLSLITITFITYTTLILKTKKLKANSNEATN